MVELDNFHDPSYEETTQPPPSDQETRMIGGPRRGRDTRPLSDSDKIDEIRSRSQRTETRLTQLMIALGVTTHAQKPEFVDGHVNLPSPHSTLKECLGCIPSGWPDPVKVYVGDDLVAVVDVSRN